jgi:hypothetical protein
LALRSLTEITTVESEYQLQAFLLRRKYQEEVRGSAAEIASVDEGLSVGNAAAGSGQWDDAMAAFTRAAELVAK